MSLRVRVVILILIVSTLFLSTCVQSYELPKFVGWGQKCRIPKPGEFLLPDEECDESKGIICQKYSQGDYCGCRIDSTSLSYDRLSGECRRMPNHRCVYVDTSTNPHALEKLPYHVKCHDNTDCVIREPHPDRMNDPPVQVCQCRPGFSVSRDNTECLNVNSAPRPLVAPGIFALALVAIFTIAS